MATGPCSDATAAKDQGSLLVAPTRILLDVPHCSCSVSVTLAIYIYIYISICEASMAGARCVCHEIPSARDNKYPSTLTRPGKSHEWNFQTVQTRSTQLRTDQPFLAVLPALATFGPTFGGVNTTSKMV